MKRKPQKGGPHSALRDSAFGAFRFCAVLVGDFQADQLGADDVVDVGHCLEDASRWQRDTGGKDLVFLGLSSETFKRGCSTYLVGYSLTAMIRVNGVGSRKTMLVIH